MNIIFIAPPAAGKGTLSDKLVEKYNYRNVIMNNNWQKDLDVLFNQLMLKTLFG